VMLRHRRRVDRRGQIGIRNRHAEVHRLAAGDRPMHRIEIEQIADDDLRTPALPCFNSSSVISVKLTACEPVQGTQRPESSRLGSYAAASVVVISRQI
jgi:hypothetical protein